MAPRLLALIAAVAMVLVAVAVRNGLDDGGGGDGGNGDRSGNLQLVCATELRGVCEALDDAEPDVDVTVEAAAATADRLASVRPADVDIDGWLTPGPWGAMVDASRGPSAGPLFADAGPVIARSPFVVAVWKDKRAALACPDRVDLGCLGDAVRERGFRLGVAPDNQAEGVLADGALAVGHIKDAAFPTNDLNETDLADWLTAVDVNVDRVTRNPGGRSFTDLLTFGPAVADGFLATEAVVAPQYAGAARRGELDLVHVTPITTADVQLAAVRGDRGDRLGGIVRGDGVRALLAEHGWRVAGQPPAPGVDLTTPRLPEDDGLPSAGVLQALREVIQ